MGRGRRGGRSWTGLVAVKGEAAMWTMVEVDVVDDSRMVDGF